MREMKDFMKTYWSLFVLGIAYCLIGLAISAFLDIYMGTVMIWNLFLGILPYFFIRLSRLGSPRHNRFLGIAFALLWLLFFPNSVYLVTDLIHINSSDFYLSINYETTYYQNILVWIEFIYIACGVLFGTLVGMISLDDVYRYLRKMHGRFSAWGSLGAICLLTGLGIFIGRFLRLNSWDALKPVDLMQAIMNAFNQFSIYYIVLIALYTLFVFALVHALRNSHLRKETDHD